MRCCAGTVQIQPRKHDLVHADYTATTRQHELDPTDPTDQEPMCPERASSSRGNQLPVRCVKFFFSVFIPSSISILLLQLPVSFVTQIRGHKKRALFPPPHDVQRTPSLLRKSPFSVLVCRRLGSNSVSNESSWV